MQRLFSTLSAAEQRHEVRRRFHLQEGVGWHSGEGVFVGTTEEDVIAALIDLEEAEINAIGDCMGGCPMIQPKLEDFVRKA
ncbi:MAG: hypothetical protein ACOX5Z_06300 [Desulfobulbus sp.]|jgi:hypothetical protein